MMGYSKIALSYILFFIFRVHKHDLLSHITFTN